DGDVVSQPDIGGAARQMGARESARHAAAAAARERPEPDAPRTRWQAAVDAATDGTTSDERGLRRVPQPDGPAWIRARELRRRRQVANRRCGFPHRCLRRAPGWDPI